MSERPRETLDHREVDNRILAIDGGGQRGLIAIRQVRKLEDELNIPAAQVFGAMGGTSTGSLITAGLVLGRTAREIENMYIHDSPGVFQRDIIGMVRSLGTMQYSPLPLQRMVRGVTGDKRLSDLSTNILITAVRFIDAKQINLDNGPNSGTGNVLLSDAVLASSFPPFYWPPHNIPSIGECYDGGTKAVAANPVKLMCDYAFQDLGYLPDKTQVISLGTGRYVGPNTRANFFELFGWVTDSVFRGPAEDQTQTARRLYPDATINRIDADLGVRIGMDDVRPETIKQLQRIGDMLAETYYWKDVLGIRQSQTSISSFTDAQIRGV